MSVVGPMHHSAAVEPGQSSSQYTVTVQLGKDEEAQVLVDPQRGPLVDCADGTARFLSYLDNGCAFNTCGVMDTQPYCKSWSQRGVTERTLLINIAAKKNRKLAQWQQAAGATASQMYELPDFLSGWAPVSWRPEDLQTYLEVVEQPSVHTKLASQKPVLGVFYSGGMSKQQGAEMVKEFLTVAAGKGITDQVLLHHPEGYDIEGDGTDAWPSYIGRLIEAIDSDADRRGRPLILWGHSKGATEAMSLATRLGERVLKVYCVASGAPRPGEVSPFQTMAENFKLGTDLDLLKWFCTMNVDRALHRMVEAVEKGDLTIESSPYLKNKLALMKRQYVTTTYPDMARDFKVIAAPIMGVWPMTDPSTPRDSVEAWSVWTSGGFELRKVSAGHMDCLRTREHHDHIALDMAAVAKEHESK